MVTTPACPCCKSSAKIYVSVHNPVDREYFVERLSKARFFRCGNCASLFQDPWPSREEAGTFYHSNYQNYEEIKVPLLAYLFAALQSSTARIFLKNLKTDSAILDFGCNQGAFLRSLKLKGFSDLTGYDVVPLKNGSDDFQFFSDLDSLLTSGKRFDVIRMNHVIEHLPDLDSTMVSLRDLLKPGGKVTGQTPNAAHHTSYWMGGYWGALHYPYHLAIFSPEGLRHSAARWGLCLERTSSSLMPTGWAMTLENVLKDLFNSKVSGRTRMYVLYLLATAPFVIFDRAFSFIWGTAIMNFTLAKETQ